MRTGRGTECKNRWQEDLHMPLSDLFFSILFYHTRCPEMSHPHRLTGTYAKAEGGQTSQLNVFP